MRDLFESKHAPDEHIVFADGILHIISGDIKEGELRCYKMIINAEFDEPIKLSDIRRRFPDASIVIFEDYLRGDIYRYGNHNDSEWERVGTTVGFA